MHSLNNFDHFHTFLMSTGTYIADRDTSTDQSAVPRPLLSASSLGRFVRRMKLKYQNLDFQEAAAFWSIFMAFRGKLSPIGVLHTNGKNGLYDENPG